MYVWLKSKPLTMNFAGSGRNEALDTYFFLALTGCANDSKPPAYVEGQSACADPLQSSRG